MTVLEACAATQQRTCRECEVMLAPARAANQSPKSPASATLKGQKSVSLGMAAFGKLDGGESAPKIRVETSWTAALRGFKSLVI